MLTWLATKLLPKKFRKSFTATAAPSKPRVDEDAAVHHSAAYAQHIGEPSTPVLSPTTLPGAAASVKTSDEAISSVATPHAAEGFSAPMDSHAPTITFRTSSADASSVGLHTPEAGCTGRTTAATPLLAAAPLQACSFSGRKTPMPTLAGAPDPTPDVARTKRYLVADGRTMGYANTFRKNAENRPLQLHATPFERLIDKELALEKRAAMAALAAQHDLVPLGPTHSVLAAGGGGAAAGDIGGEGGMVTHTPLRTLRQMR